jgi:hypothetical protein
VALLRISKERKINYMKFYLLVFGYFLSNIYKYSLKDLVAFKYWATVYLISILGAFAKRHEKRTKIYVKYKREPRIS